MKSKNAPILLLTLVTVLAVSLFVRFRSPPQTEDPINDDPDKISFRFTVPANSRVGLLWEDDDTGEVKRIGLKASPGALIKVEIEKGDPAIPALNELPKSFFFEVPADNPGGGETEIHPGIKLIDFKNQQLSQSRFRFYWEDYSHPVLGELRRREQLDDLVQGAKDELEFFTRILKWTHKQWKEGNPDPYPPFNALLILDWIRQGKTTGFCAQYAQVMVQSLHSFGHSARYVSLANHEVLEVWSNQHAKWIVMDPTDGIYYTDGKQPLNAHELYLTLAEENATQVQTVGAEHNPQRIGSYGVFSIATRNDHLSQNRPPSAILKDLWKERIHLITPHNKDLPYHEGKLRPVTTFVSDVYFPMNSAHVKLLQPNAAGSIVLQLATDMPGFSRYQASRNGGPDERIPAMYIWELQPGRNTIEIVAQNQMGVSGPRTKIVVEKL
ncbi:MAG: transglutaminase-like domain-containing protein [Planctomycetota bacterium]|nr:transglutaminase-like domain-containing protein [Planctomycetota bacterium]